MGFAMKLWAIVSFLTLVLSQTAPIAFTSVPAVVVAGSTTNITWGGGDGFTPVTITLRKGNPSNLTTVAIIADGVAGTSFLWNVSTSLVTASDYALQITQGQGEINYSGLFSIVAGSGTSSISFSGTTTATSNSSSTMNVTSTVGTIGTGTAMPRNTTFVTPTMGQTITSMPNATQRTTATATTASGTSAPSSSSSGVAGHVESSAALAMAVLAAVMCLA